MLFPPKFPKYQYQAVPRTICRNDTSSGDAPAVQPNRWGSCELPFRASAYLRPKYLESMGINPQNPLKAGENRDINSTTGLSPEFRLG